MKNKNKILIFLTVIFTFGFKNISYPNKIEILYIVENYPITNKDITKEINYLTMLNDSLRQLEDKDLIKYASKSIIKEKVKKVEIQKNFQLGQNEKQVKDQLDNYIKKLNLTNETFQDLLNQFGITKKYLEEKIEIEFLWNRLVYSKYKDKVIINKEAIKQKLKKDLENPENFLDEFLLYEILFSPSSKSDFENDKVEIQKSIDEIGFENSAKIYSESDSAKLGGKIGWVNENQVSKNILSNIRGINIGEYTQPIIVPGGYLIIYLEDKKKSKLELSFDDELNKILKSELNRQLDQYSLIFYKKTEINTKIYDN